MNEKYRSFWDSQADEWKNHAAFGSAREYLEKLVIKEISPLTKQFSGDYRLLNLGSGSNSHSYLKNLVNPEAVNNLDFSYKMLQLQKNTRNIQADAGYTLPLKSNSIDLCTSFYLMRYLSQDEQNSLLGEIHRVLKPEGHVILVDLFSNEYPQQMAKFDSDWLCAKAKKIKFKQAEAQTHRQEITVYGPQTGFGRDSFIQTLHYKVLRGQK